MKTVLIVYASTRGYTAHAARAVADGAILAGCEVALLAAEDAQAADLMRCDALVLGTPIHMGSADWRVKRFIDTVCAPFWMKDGLIGKVGGVFATGGGYGSGGGGVDLCLVGMFSNLAQLGMLMVPLPRNSPGFAQGGSPWGPYCRSQQPDLVYRPLESLPMEACRAHGFNVGALAMGLDASTLFPASQPGWKFNELPHSA